MSVPILNPTQHWECPNCGLQDVTHNAGVGTRYHNCPKLAGLSAPMLPAGTRGHLRAVERGDYVGKDIVTKDGNGRPIMAIVTEREEGQDCVVLAPTVTGVGD